MTSRGALDKEGTAVQGRNKQDASNQCSLNGKDVSEKASDQEFFATCAKGFEGLLAGELKQLNAKRVRPLQAGVSFYASEETAYRICLWSRIASRVLRVIARVPAQNADELYAATKKIGWPALFSPEKTLSVHAKGANAALRNTKFTALCVKDAICDALRAATGKRPDIDLAQPDVRIRVNVHGKKATLYADYAGESLHVRGYRGAGGGQYHAAPLKEALAAGMLAWAGWGPKVGHGRIVQPEERIFVDPVCGTGTLVLEAAMIATDRAPGLLRARWGFEGFASYSSELFDKIIDEADARFEAGLEHLQARFVGTDIDGAAIEAAQASATALGLAGRISFVQADCSDIADVLAGLGIDIFSRPCDGSADEATHRPVDISARDPHDGSFDDRDTLTPSPHRREYLSGFVAANPPYGIRMAQGELDSFYDAFKTGISQLPTGWTLEVITADELFDMHVGLSAKETLAVYNGPVEATLRLYDLARVVSQQLELVDLSGKPVSVDVFYQQSEQFAARLRKVAKERRKWASAQGFGAYRVYANDLPDYVCTIDMYVEEDTGAEHLVIAEYRAPREIDPNKAARKFQDIVAITQVLYGVDDEHIHIKHRQQARGGSQYYQNKDAFSFAVSVPEVSDEAQVSGLSEGIFAVSENGLSFEVHMEGALDTGLFIDHRPVRELVQKISRDKNVLNLFAYTGAASVYAQAGGARSVTTVDMNTGYLAWAERNMALNGLQQQSQRFVRADTLQWIKSGKTRSARRGNSLQGRDHRGESFQGRETVPRACFYDVVFVDPPTFSNSKSMDGKSWDIQRDYVQLLLDLRPYLAPGATVIFSGNLRSFKLDTKALEKGGYSVEDWTSESIPLDCSRNQKVHFCYLLRFA